MVTASTLVVLPSYQPFEIVSWQDAVTEVYCEQTARVMSTYENLWVHSTRQKIPVPAVILREDAIYKPRAFTNVVPFNRENLFHRDDGRCMYCGKQVPFDDFTFEHVIPQDQGGEANWLNIVVACLKCNGRKKNRTPEQAHMTLIRKPFAPKLDYFISKKLVKRVSIRIPHKSWYDYMYWLSPIDPK
jgi:5-methylcytosine-specific restriction endonuclease McrA